ncbi:dihydroxyacetone kinase family protein [Nitrosomonas mobilis]|uniref:Dak kinase n=1 Tax=Nitrosomonas mobilis TaxID=51642 RepID=A0A1G5SJL0_9PROT|nr:dihydroxyacetone kinase family protein [Nitrosomonas mobilis]SCZ87187.1 Dak kinase [Nitrosomonas mobilis]
MTYLFNQPEAFVNEMIQGFAAAHRNHILPVDGGVIRCHKAKPGQVVVVIGGGSGHYPAFGGLVGQGLAHGAAMGNVFASPSAHQICNVALAANTGGGIVFCYGNYAGDVLNFNQAQERLQAQGIDVRAVVVTDDIAAAPPAERHLRRGIAGTLPVFKAAGAAADAGESLDEVCRIATEANARVRTLGVAFSGCTLPGARQPLFDVSHGKMAVGMGIHGEPGLHQMDALDADGLAEMLFDKLMQDIPPVIDHPEGARVGAILNSLGSVAQEELYVVYRRVDQLLRGRGLVIVEPVVDRVITSFDMAGVSLTLFWLNDELEHYWLAPADTPAFKRSIVSGPLDDPAGHTALIQPIARQHVTTGSRDSQKAAAVILEALESAMYIIDTQREELGRLDAVAGDGDHGIGMQRGLTAAVDAARKVRAAQAGAGTLLTAAGDAWAACAGGTSGALWGVMLCSLGHVLGDTVMPDTATVATGVATALSEVKQRGKAQPGDKTLVDVLQPFAAALDQAVARGISVAVAWKDAADVAHDAAQKTRDLLPRIGRARPHAEKSIGTPDPGAVSLALVIGSVGEVIRRHCA